MSDVSKIKEITEVIMYQTSDGNLHRSMSSARWHADQLEQVHTRNEMLKGGSSIGDIFEHTGRTVPDPILYKVTKDTKLVIGHWQCKDTPGYKPIRFEMNGCMHCYGDVGSWSGPYGADVQLSDLIRYAKHESTEL